MALTKSDLNQIRTIVGEEVGKEVEKQLEKKLDEKLSGYPTKDEFYAETSKILAAVNKKDEEDAAHKLLHNNLGEEVPDLQHKVSHLYKKLNISLPATAY